MKRSFSARLKALFLLFAFSLSTVVGFACSIGMEMEFNTDHHKNEKDYATAELTAGKIDVPVKSDHPHPEGVKPHHHEKPQGYVDQTKQFNDLSDNSQKKEKDDCCQDEVAKIQMSDKRIQQAADYSFQSLFILISPFSTSVVDALASDQHTPSNRHFVRNHHPPQADTRIAIQSFLI